MTESGNSLATDLAIAPPRSARPRAAEASASPPLSAAVLLGKLHAVRFKHQWVSAGEGAALALILLLGLLLTGMILDWSLGLPLWVRALILIFDVAGLAWLCWRRIVKPVVRAPDDPAVALLVEDAKPEFRSRLISAVQLAGPGGLPPGSSRAIAGKLIEQTIDLCRSIRMTDVVSVHRLWRVVPWTLTAILLFAALFAWGQPVSMQLLRRAFLSSIPVPCFTDVQVLTGNLIIAGGDTVKFQAIARRVIPSGGKVELKYASGRTQMVRLDRSSDHAPYGAMFAGALGNVQESFDYRIKLNDNLSQPHHVDVEPSPEISAVQFRVILPAYTHRSPMILPPDALTAVRGSRLHIQITASKSLRNSSVKLVGTHSTIPLQGDPAHPAMASAEFAVKDRCTGIAIQMVDSFGLHNADPVVYPLKVVPDRPPVIAIVFPKEKESLATRKAKFIIGYSGGDDFGIDTLRLCYQVDGGPVVSMPIAIERGRLAMAGQYTWDMSAIPAPPGKADLTGSTIEYWLAAADANNLTGPGVSQSEHLTVKSVTEQEKRIQLAQQEAEIISAFGNTAADQKSVTNDVGHMVEQRPADKQK